MRRPRTLVTAGIALLVLAISGCTPEEMQGLWAVYGNNNDRTDDWTGGDGTYSVPLPDGRVAWLFSDTYLGTVEPGASRSSPPPLVNNSIVVQDSLDGDLGPTLLSQAPGGGLAGRIISSDHCNVRYWVNDGTVEGNVLRVFVYRHERQPACPAGGGQWVATGTGIATLSLPDLELQGEPQAVPSAHPDANGFITWGVSILEDGEFTYIYGHAQPADNIFVNTMYAARVPSGALTGPWQYWTGSGWSDTIGDAAPVAGPTGARVERSGGVLRDGDRYVLLGKENQWWADTIDGYTAPTPVGPFTGPTHVYTIPEHGEPCGNSTLFTYRVKPHPEFVQDDGTVMVSYNVHCHDSVGNWSDVYVYRARFVGLTLPD